MARLTQRCLLQHHLLKQFEFLGSLEPLIRYGDWISLAHLAVVTTDRSHDTLYLSRQTKRTGASSKGRETQYNFLFVINAARGSTALRFMHYLFSAQNSPRHNRVCFAQAHPLQPFARSDMNLRRSLALYQPLRSLSRRPGWPANCCVNRSSRVVTGYLNS